MTYDIIYSYEINRILFLRTIQPQQKNKVSNFQLKYNEKTAASAAQFAKCILLHAYSSTTASSHLRENKQNLHSLQAGITVFLVIQ